jgi:Lon protease-like protein
MSRDNVGRQIESGNQVKPIVSQVFPLPVFLLSGGMQRLRIFEKKYVSMVANAEPTDGFVISMAKKHHPYATSDWGAHVRVVDFDKGDDGVLTIDVLADNLVSLSGFEYGPSGILTAKIEILPHWSSICGSSEKDNCPRIEKDGFNIQFSFVLNELFKVNDELGHLYKTHFFDYAEWVSARLLEIIPLPLSEKEKFVHKLDLNQLNQLLACLFEKEPPKSDLYTWM